MREVFRTASCPTSESSIPDGASLLRACMDGADGVDRVRVRSGLVGAVTLDAREAQRDSSRIARAGLDAVERDLDDELGPDVDDVSLALGRDPEEMLRLPREHLVGHSLEGLAQHDERAMLRIPRAEMQVRELSLATAVAPLRCENHEVERVRRLHLQPAGTATPRFVRRVESLHHDALVPSGEGVVEKRLSLHDVV